VKPEAFEPEPEMHDTTAGQLALAAALRGRFGVSKD
jgi:hypothetical protein